VAAFCHAATLVAYSFNTALTEPSTALEST
jgi:hypothetical protein